MQINRYFYHRKLELQNTGHIIQSQGQFAKNIGSLHNDNKK